MKKRHSDSGAVFVSSEERPENEENDSRKKRLKQAVEEKGFERQFLLYHRENLKMDGDAGEGRG